MQTLTIFRPQNPPFRHELATTRALNIFEYTSKAVTTLYQTSLLLVS